VLGRQKHEFVFLLLPLREKAGMRGNLCRKIPLTLSLSLMGRGDFETCYELMISSTKEGRIKSHEIYVFFKLLCNSV
jgi:hypothetical protein